MRLARSLLIVVSTAALVAMAPRAWAQDQAKDKPADKPAAAAPTTGNDSPRAGQRAGGRGGQLQQIIEQLNLTDDQKAQAKPILEDLRHAMEEARNLQPPERGQKIQQAMKDARDKLSQILTEEQRTKLKELLANTRGAGANAAGGPAARLQAALADLNLTDEQKPKIKAIVDEYRPKMEEIMKNAKGDRQSAMQQIRPIMQEMRDKITAILTPEQAQKFRDSFQGGRGGAGGANRPGGKQRQATGGNA